MMQRILRIAGLFLLSGVLWAAPSAANTRVYIGVAPPSPIVETRTAPPHRGYVWHDGYHRWDGHRYVWMRGRWVRAPYVGARWTTGRWAYERRGWYWVPGHWAHR
jgi:hypothetical protein